MPFGRYPRAGLNPLPVLRIFLYGPEPPVFLTLTFSLPLRSSSQPLSVHAPRGNHTGVRQFLTCVRSANPPRSLFGDNRLSRLLCNGTRDLRFGIY